MPETVCLTLMMSAEDLGSLQLEVPPLGLSLAAGVAPEPGTRHGVGAGDFVNTFASVLLFLCPSIFRWIRILVVIVFH